MLGSTTLENEQEGRMALAGDTQQASVLVVQRVGVQDSTYMAGEHRAGGDRAKEDRAEGTLRVPPLHWLRSTVGGILVSWVNRRLGHILETHIDNISLHIYTYRNTYCLFWF